MAIDFPASPSVGQKYPVSPIAGVPTYTWDGEKWTTNVNAIVPILPGTIKVIKRSIWLVSGTYIPSAGLVYADFECVGAGGGAGGPNVAGGFSCGSGGGGSGAYSRKLCTAAQIGASQPVTVGAQGSGGGGGGDGITGGASSVGSLCIAYGGGGGGTTSPYYPGNGANGGQAGVGDICSTGMPGHPGAGGNASYILGTGGNGGSSIFGGSAPGFFSGGSVNGYNATGWGGGGGGGVGTAGAAGGGWGAQGVVYITEYCTQ